MKRLLFMLSKYISTPFLFSQSLSISDTKINNTTVYNDTTNDITSPDQLYWTGKQLEYYIYQCCDINNNQELTSLVKTVKEMKTTYSDDEKNTQIFDEDQADEFIMRFINSQLLWSKVGWNSYDDFFTEATSYWLQNAEGVRTKLWDIINHWFINIYTTSLYNNWFSNLNWVNYKTYVDDEINNNGITKIEFASQKETDISPSDLGFNFYYLKKTNSWEGENFYDDYVHPSSISISKQILGNKFSDISDINEQIWNNIISVEDSNSDLITLMPLENTSWSTKGLDKEYNNYKKIFSNVKYSTFSELNKYYSVHSKNNNKSDKYGEYDPGCNISLYTSFKAWAKYWRVSESDLNKIEDDVLKTFNILSYFSNLKDDILDDYLYTFQIANDDVNNSKLITKEIRNQWVQTNSNDDQVTYRSSQSSSIIISGSRLKDSTISNKYISFETSLRDGTSMIYKSAGYILDGINGFASSFSSSEKSLYKSYVNSGEWLPTTKFNDYELFGYGQNYYDYVVQKSYSNLISNIALYTSIGCTSVTATSLVVYNYISNNKLNSKKRSK